MNYYAHGYGHLDDPYFLAGTATPDWLCVVNRSVRVRSKAAAPWAHDPDRRVASLARGIMQHHQDDAWFHQTRAFHELSMRLSQATGECLPDGRGFQSRFLGHVLVEVLLDAALIEDAPPQLDRYYESLAQVDPQLVERTVAAISGRSGSRLGWFIPRFCAERFLYDYADDGKLLARLNRVMGRVRMAALPPTLRDLLPAARRSVRGRAGELLNGRCFHVRPDREYR